jgi:hypothetical protein
MGATCLATFLPPDLGSFCRLDELGLQVVGQRLEPRHAVLACRVVETDKFARWCCRCGCEAAPRDSVTRGWRISRWGCVNGARRRCSSRSAAIAAPAAGMCRASTPAGPHPRIPEPDELHRTLVARSRRIQTPTTPSTAMSRNCPSEGKRGTGTSRRPGLRLARLGGHDGGRRN